MSTRTQLHAIKLKLQALASGISHQASNLSLLLEDAGWLASADRVGAQWPLRGKQGRFEACIWAQLELLMRGNDANGGLPNLS